MTMEIDVLSLFPRMLEGPLSESIIQAAERIAARVSVGALAEV